MTINDLVVFIYESGICLAVLFALYWFSLRRETYFRFNRFYLLATLLTAFLLPLANLRLFTLGSEAATLGGISNLAGSIRIPEVNLGEASAGAGHQAVSWNKLLIVTYLAGASLLMARTIAGIGRLAVLRKRGRLVRREGYNIVYLNQALPPFSFLKTIYLNDSMTEGPDQDSIICHERIHIQQLHTYDNLLVEFFLAIFWFNPFMWFLKGALRTTHEYLADNGVLAGNTSRTGYQSLLLKQLMGISAPLVTSSFNSIIKKRIKMMYRNKSSVLAKLKPLLALPFVILLTLVFACSELPENPMMDGAEEIVPDEMLEINDPPEGIADNQAEPETPEEEVFFIVEEMPTFDGGDPAVEFRKYVAANLQYPVSELEMGTEGRVIIQFAVDKNGKVRDVNVVRSVNPAIDAEAVRVVESSPAWEPGKQRGKAVSVLFTFPINFIAPK